MVPGPGETIRSDDYHTAGEPFRIVDAGPMEGTTVLERRSWAVEHLDDLRRFLVGEPRGHADMYGGFVVPADDDRGDLGVVFFHNHGFSTACGHGTIALVTWAIDTGLIVAQGHRIPVVVDVPSGRLPTEATLAEGRVASVRFTNVPAFVTAVGVEVDTSLGPVTLDVSFGGAFYASVAVDELPVSVAAEHLGELVAVDREVRAATSGAAFAEHPDDDRLSGVYGTVFHETVGGDPLHQRNVTVFADGQVDRSPCGSGTSARMVLLHQAGLLAVGDEFCHDGIVGGRFLARIEEETPAGVVTSVEGSAHRHATTTFHLDPHDPLSAGFLLQ